MLQNLRLVLNCFCFNCKVVNALHPPFCRRFVEKIFENFRYFFFQENVKFVQNKKLAVFGRVQALLHPAQIPRKRHGGILQ